MRVLITGGTGFIGSRVGAMAAERGHTVTLLSRAATHHSGPTVMRFDLTKPAGLAELLRGFDTVIHCAAAMRGSEADQRATTVDGTRNLVHAMAEAGLGRIILVSTFAVYDYRALSPDSVLTEDAPLDANGGERGPYVGAKREQERIVVTAGHLRDWTVFRPGLVFGPGRTWFYHLGMRLPRTWVTMAGSATLPLTYVDNCAAAIAAALDAPRSLNKVINVVDDQLPTRRQYVGWLAESEPERPRIVDIPWRVLDAASRGAWVVTHHGFRDRITPPGSLHPSVLAARCKPLRYDNSRARDLLGWEPRVSVPDGLRMSLEPAR